MHRSIAALVRTHPLPLLSWGSWAAKHEAQEQMDGKLGGNERMAADGCRDEWMDGQMDGWVNGMDE